MPRPYSLDLRERLFRARAAGLSAAEVERTLGVSRRTQRRWAQRRWARRLASGAALAPTPLPGRVRTITETDEADLRAQVAAHPDATLAMHCAQWAAAGKTPVSPATMSRTLARLELPLKKTLIARERDAAARAAFRAEAAGWDPADLVVLDETSTPTTLTPLRARAPRGERAVGTVPRGRWEQVTLICALTSAGVAAPTLLSGALDRDACDVWVAEQLVPALRPGQTVLLANLSVHKSATARRLIADAGCGLRHLPTSSPDMNLIEPAFAKVKTAQRRAEARTFDGLVAAAKPALDAVTPADARGFDRAAGCPLPHGQPL